jgi:hypothetical protein
MVADRSVYADATLSTTPLIANLSGVEVIMSMAGAGIVDSGKLGRH